MKLDPVKKQEKFKKQSSFKYFNCFFCCISQWLKIRSQKLNTYTYIFFFGFHNIKRKEAKLSICFLNCDHNKKQNKENLVVRFWFLVTVWSNTRNIYQKIIETNHVMNIFPNFSFIMLISYCWLFPSIQGLCMNHLIFKVF